jgi:hypothetical protein
MAEITTATKAESGPEIPSKPTIGRRALRHFALFD